MSEQMNLQELDFTDLLDIYTTRSLELGQEPDESHKTKEALIAAIEKMSSDVPQRIGDGEEGTPPGENGDKQQKYNSTNKRGPNQGIGAFAKEQIVAGKSNTEILDMIAKQFPTARTSLSCIAYYRNAVKKGGTPGKGSVSGDPAALRAKAAELIAKADELEKRMREDAMKGGIEAKIREEVEARIRAEVEAKYAEVKKQMEEEAAKAAGQNTDNTPASTEQQAAE